MVRRDARHRNGAQDLRTLQRRLRAAESALRAIEGREVDAVMSRSGERVIALAGAEFAYHIVLDQMNESAVTLTRDGIVTYCNRSLAELLGVPQEALVGATLTRFVARGEMARFEAMRRDGVTGDVRGESTLRTADQRNVAVAVSFAPLSLRGRASPIGIVGVLRDITERRELDRERERLTGLLITAQEEERRRMARELHDEIGQSLTALLVGLRTIEGANTLDRSAKLAQGLRETTARTLADVGRMWRGLHPGVLDELEFGAAIERHVRDFAQASSIRAKVTIARLDPRGLTMPLRATVYRLVQEALNNVVHHAEARSVTVALRRSQEVLEVRVEDDGRGFVPGKEGRLGLRAMRERAALLGGSVEVTSSLGKGTRIRARFPLKDP